VGETFSKVGLYLTPWRHYWSPTRGSGVIRELDYPIDFAPRLADGHFTHFDEAGVPLRSTPAGPIHNYTRICGFALAHWSAIGPGRGTPSDRAAFLSAADYLMQTGQRVGAEVRLRAEVPGHGHVGRLSAMSQGQAMSVLVRAHHLTRDQRYLDAALACVGVFERTIEDEGVSTRWSSGGLWFEEDTRQPARHILNGMIFALWGLEDAAHATASSAADRLYRSGLDTLRERLTNYDSGSWSLYDRPDRGRPYIASMRYHELHIAQLQALATVKGEELFDQVAERFARYARSMPLRLRAGMGLAIGKLRRDFRHTNPPEDSSEA
jgi:heparosan-N-sulfate-glucuronate 5-epimerase